MNEIRTAPGTLCFYASKTSRLSRSRWQFAVAGAVGLIIALVTQHRSVGSMVFTSVLFFIIFGLADYGLRRQLRPGQPIVTLSDEFIASPALSGKSKRLSWTDIEYSCLTSIQNTPLIEFVLRPSPGIGNRRSFWSGVHPARPRLPLSAFSPEDQENLFTEVLRRHVKSCTAEQLETFKAPPDELREAREAYEFEARMKALQPHTWITYGLIAINLLIWALTLTQGAGLARSPAEKLLLWGGNAASEVQKGEWWRLLSATFLHSGFMHVAMNMVGLYSAGVAVERIYGKRLYLLIYLSSGLMGSALSLHYSAQQVVSVGASGAVFGVTGALLVAVFQNRHSLPKTFSRQASGGLAFFILYALIQGFGTQGIDNAAHLGGLLGGGLAAFILPERFDMTVYQRTFMKRAAAAIAVMAGVTTSLAAMAPAAVVDQGRIVASAPWFERGLRHFDQGMHALLQETEAIKSGKISERDAEERSRTVLAPIFREIVADLSQVSLRPDDSRRPFLDDIKRMSELLAESLEMDSVYNETTQKYEPIDPDRSAKIASELTSVSERIAAFMKKSKSKT